MKKYTAAGLVYGQNAHHLDHLATLCILLDIPLIVTQQEIETLANHYYPHLVTFCMTPLEIGEKVVCNYHVIFSSLPKHLFDQIFFVAENLLNKKLLNIWVPHGNSDKGHVSYFMEALKEEKIALVYGQKMIDFLIEKKVYSQLYAAIFLGNYRYFFYKKHTHFYDQCVQKEIVSHLPEAKETLLYAPTWEDAENSSSLKSVWEALIETLPRDWNLIIKLHPNMLHKLFELESLFHAADSKPNVLVLEQFPPIYPLLNKASIYLGDMSSIGYDFLRFDRPMFFLNQNERDPKKDKGLYLYRCGIQIEPKDYSHIISIIELHLPDDQKRFQKIRQEVYDYVFGSKVNQEEIKTAIIQTYERYLEEELQL